MLCKFYVRPLFGHGTIGVSEPTGSEPRLPGSQKPLYRALILCQRQSIEFNKEQASTSENRLRRAKENRKSERLSSDRAAVLPSCSDDILRHLTPGVPEISKLRMRSLREQAVVRRSLSPSAFSANLSGTKGEKSGGRDRGESLFWKVHCTLTNKQLFYFVYF